MDSYSTPHRDSVSSVIFGIDVSGAAIFWPDVSHRHSLWLPMGKTSAITKRLCIKLVLSFPAPLHLGTVYLVSYLASGVSGACYILGGSLSETLTMATYSKN